MDDSPDDLGDAFRVGRARTVWGGRCVGIPGEVFPLALATAASPLPLLALLVVLLTARAVPNGLAFALGWAIALLTVGTATVALVGSGAGLDEQGLLVSALEVVVGLAILILAGRQWKRRPRGGAEAVAPGWLQAADRCTPRGAFAMGVVLVLANPKNLALTVAAAGVVAGASTAAGDRVWALVLFTVLGTAGLAVPLSLRIVLGDRAIGTLTRWRRWLMVHGTPAGCALLGVVGALLVVRGATV